MVALRNLAFTILAVAMIVPGIDQARGGTPPAESLFSQSILETLNRDFSAPDISFLLLDARSGQRLASRWEHSETPIPMGSLAKPFTALAYGEHHGFRFPTHVCHGTTSGCWRPQGHGTLSLASAITYSCNSYFRALASDLDREEVSATASRFGLESPDNGTSGPALAGLGGEWRTSPEHMALAYIELLCHRDDPTIAEIFEGMADSARLGTAAEVDRALSFKYALAKTGTAPCTHSRHGPGDGFTLAMFPADAPRVLLLVRVHGVPGAEAAKTAGKMLRRIED